MSRRRFTRMSRIEAFHLSDESDRPIMDLDNDPGIHPNTLYGRRKQQLKDGEEAFPGPGKMEPGSEEVHRLRRELQRAREERDR